MNESENGEIMIESILVMIPTLFVVLFLLSLGFLLYQQCNVQYVADDLANRVAGSYSFLDSDFETGTITIDDLEDRGRYRYCFGNKEKYDADSRKEAKSYGTKLLDKTSYGEKKSTEQISVTVETDSFARRHATVTVIGEYKIPFGEGLEVFGISSTRKFEATSVAECVDLSDYLSTVTYADNFVSLITGDSSKVIKMIDTWLKVIQDGIDLIANIVSE